MQPIKGGIHNGNNKIPLSIKSDNEAKCMHALCLLNQVATEKQKEALLSKNAPDLAAREASHEAVQCCMIELLNMECQVGFKTREQIQKNSSRSRSTAIAIGMRYQKITAFIEKKKEEEHTNARIARLNA